MQTLFFTRVGGINTTLHLSFCGCILGQFLLHKVFKSVDNDQSNLPRKAIFVPSHLAQIPPHTFNHHHPSSNYTSPSFLLITLSIELRPRSSLPGDSVSFSLSSATCSNLYAISPPQQPLAPKTLRVKAQPLAGVILTTRLSQTGSLNFTPSRSLVKAQKCQYTFVPRKRAPSSSLYIEKAQTERKKKDAAALTRAWAQIARTLGIVIRV